MRVLAADIGGTKTLLAIADVDGENWHIVHHQRHVARDFDDFDAMLAAFVSAGGEATRGIERACIAVAGPRSTDVTRVRVTNLDWELETARLSPILGGAPVTLINDFAAVGYGIDRLAPDELETLQAGQPQPRAPRVVIGAGTGLGVGQQVWHGDRYTVLPSEGGHVDFAPIGALQRELLAWMEQRLDGHVSVERLVSGPGLVTLFEFLCEREPQRTARSPAQARDRDDPAAAIATAAASGRDPLAAAAVDLMLAIYGAQAGNLALIALPRGGLYLAGGIAPKLIDRLRHGPFLAAFNAKGRMSHLTAAIPVRVILNPQVGLLGAIQAAATRPPRNRS